MKLQLANYRSCLLLCMPFSSSPFQTHHFPLNWGLIPRGKRCPFFITHGAASIPLEKKEESRGGGFSPFVPISNWGTQRLGQGAMQGYPMAGEHSSLCIPFQAGLAALCSAAGHTEVAFGEWRYHQSTAMQSCRTRSTSIGAASRGMPQPHQGHSLGPCHRARASQHSSPTRSQGVSFTFTWSAFITELLWLFDYFPPNPRAEWENKAFRKLSLGEKSMPHHHSSAK